MKINEIDRQEARKIIDQFKRSKSSKEVFYDLCFAICAPQTTFKSNLKVNESLKTYGFFNWEDSMFDTIGIHKLEDIVKPTRFYRNKTKWLIEMKKNYKHIYDSISMINFLERDDPAPRIREWLVENVKGLGMKAASHFLRNLGCEDLAVIDTHILKFFDEHWIEIHTLGKYTLSKEARWAAVGGRGLSKKTYLEIELVFKNIAKDNNLSAAELDAIIWKQRSNTEWKDFVY